MIVRIDCIASVGQAPGLIGVGTWWHQTHEIVVVERCRLVECRLRTTTRYFEVVKTSLHCKKGLWVHWKQGTGHGLTDRSTAVVERVCCLERDIDRWRCQRMSAKHSGNKRLRDTILEARRAVTEVPSRSATCLIDRSLVFWRPEQYLYGTSLDRTGATVGSFSTLGPVSRGASRGRLGPTSYSIILSIQSANTCGCHSWFADWESVLKRNVSFSPLHNRVGIRVTLRSDRRCGESSG
jgi:hypothetical protein